MERGGERGRRGRSNYHSGLVVLLGLNDIRGDLGFCVVMDVVDLVGDLMFVFLVDG